ncbi:cupin domain-containing protein [Paenibacillus dakarensis]|uniref:cupin domain-containing protein n=1 Tax=Paenibacillus dakarensis TaxID=1527293 RepID=UPI000A9DB98C|nr:cupin domain-containing protein [Paenibacillus dakarensis]
MFYRSESSTYPSSDLAMNQEQMSAQVIEAIFTGIKREAASIDLYSRLAEDAKDEYQKDQILQALELKKTHFDQFTNLYVTLTGVQPDYRMDQVTYEGYEEGLKKAHEAGIAGYSEYRRNSSFISNTPINQLFTKAALIEIEHAARFGSLIDEARKDFGPNPFVINIEDAAEENRNYRTALWTGKYFQVTLMSIPVGEDVGLEVHPMTDQFIRIEEGQGLVQMGDRKDHLNIEEKVKDGYAIMIPAGTWHNVTNTGRKPLKLYVIYAPPHHPHGTVHPTKAAAMAAGS